MASIVLGSIVADARGKVGSEVYSRNGAGSYVRSVPSWSQPDSQRQLDCRAALTALSQYWSGTLSQTQRDSWVAYAQHYPSLNVWGHPLITTPYLCFVRHNAHYYRHSPSVLHPTAPTFPPLHQCRHTITANSGNNQIAFTMQPRTDWEIPDYFRAYCFAGRQTNPGVSYFQAPWRYMGTYSAHSTAWFPIPKYMTYPSGPVTPPPQTWAVLTQGQRVHTYVVVQSYEHGPISSRYQTSCIVS